MRTNIAFLSAATAGLLLSNALEVPVYTFDPTPLSSQASLELPSLNPENTRLLLAHRLGLSQYHSLKDADERTISLINNFGGKQDLLFNQHEKEDDAQRVLVFVEGIQNPKDLFDYDIRPAFTISNAPSSSSNLQLVRDFLLQDEHRRGSASRCSSGGYKYALVSGGYSGNGPHGTCLLRKNLNIDIKGKAPVTELDNLLPTIRHDLDDDGLQGSTIILHIATLEAVGRQRVFDSEGYSETLASIKKMLTALLQQTELQQSTVVLVPPMSSNVKRAEKSYGSYVLPTISSTVPEQQEERLSMLTTPEASSSTSQEIRHSQPHTLNASSLPKTTLPVCHSSHELCVATTNGCSGHGRCHRKYTDKDSSPGSDCWSCRCVPSVRTNADGKVKTTYWGGPACQKKDISTPFFLLASFSIVMVATVSWGIGLMYSIGQEDLPSVIGAGVTGPRAQK